MLRIRVLVVCVAGLALLSSVALAGKFNKTLSVGDAAPAWSGAVGTDGKPHGLADYKDAKLVVLTFTCNHCPVAQAYEDRLVALVKQYKDKGVRLVAVNCNRNKADDLEAMTKHAKEQGFNFDYVYDESQQIGRDYGSTVTPQVFVLDKDRKVAYMGAFDDSMDPAKVEHHYVRDAVDALLAGKKPEVTESRPFGCGIQYE
jgi:peroxiredoxin